MKCFSFLSFGKIHLLCYVSLNPCYILSGFFSLRSVSRHLSEMGKTSFFAHNLSPLRHRVAIMWVWIIHYFRWRKREKSGIDVLVFSACLAQPFETVFSCFMFQLNEKNNLYTGRKSSFNRDISKKDLICLLITEKHGKKRHYNLRYRM